MSNSSKLNGRISAAAALARWRSAQSHFPHPPRPLRCRCFRFSCRLRWKQPRRRSRLRPRTKTSAFELPARLRRQVVSYPTREAPGTIIIDTPNTYLYLVLGNGQAMRYGIGIGRDGFTWSGTQTITRKAEWPAWTPPPEMIARQPYLPRHMAGGPGNPLGARAMYLGGTIYRIHGTNAPETIGTRVSSGCLRLTNEDVKRSLFAGQRRHQGDRAADGGSPRRSRQDHPLGLKKFERESAAPAFAGAVFAFRATIVQWPGPAGPPPAQ